MIKLKLSDAQKRLKDILQACPSLGIAVSGGADSTLLAKVAADVMPESKLVLVHALLPFSPKRESEFIQKWASDNGLKLHILEIDMLQYDDVVRNDSRRCYYCKHKIMGALSEEMHRQGIEVVADGTVTDDYGDYRPGLDAAAEHNIQHPLADAGFDKRMIRLLARKLHLPGWNMPASACLASRIQCGIALTREVLEQVGTAEDYLFDLGFAGNRVRVVGTGLACIEVNSLHLARLFRLRRVVSAELQKIGFKKVMIDLNGYTRGAMNTPV